jgi:hypothetical protein
MHASFLPLPLPLPHDLISLVTDHILMKGWMIHQSIHQRTINKIRLLVEEWPIEEEDDHLRYPSHARLHRDISFIWRDPNWCYASAEPGSDLRHPWPSIDQMLEIDMKNKKYENPSL